VRCDAGFRRDSGMGIRSLRLKGDLVLLLVAILWGSAFAAQRVAGCLAACISSMQRASWWRPSSSFPLRRGRRSGGNKSAGCALRVQFCSQPARCSKPDFRVPLRERRLPHESVCCDRAVCHVLRMEGTAKGAFHSGSDPRRPWSIPAFHGWTTSCSGRDVLELGGAALWAVHVVLLGRFAAPYDAISFSAGQLLVGGMLNWIASAMVEPPSLPIPPGLVASILYTAIISLGLGYTLQIWDRNTHLPRTQPSS